MSISAVIDVPITGGFGDQRATPFTITDLHDDYHLGIGGCDSTSAMTFDREQVTTKLGVTYVTSRQEDRRAHRE